MNWIWNNLRHLDLFGKRFGFKVENSESFKTWYGTFASLLCAILVIIGLSTCIVEVLDKTTPVSSMGTLITGVYPKMDLYHEGHVPGLALYSFQMGLYLVNSSLVFEYITPVAFIKTIDFSLESGNLSQKTVVVPVVPCNSLNSTRLIKIIEEDEKAACFMNYFGICPKIDDKADWQVEGQFPHFPYTKIEYKVFPCSLSNKSKCKLFEDIAQMKAILGMLEKTLNLSSQTDPIDSRLNSDIEYSLSPNHTLTSIISFMETSINDDEQEFQEPKTTFSYIEMDKVITNTGFRDGTIYCSTDSIYNGECIPYFIIEMRSGSQQRIIQRYYRKYFDTLSNMGGLFQVMIALGKILFYSINKCQRAQLLKRKVMFYKREIFYRLRPTIEKNNNSKRSKQKLDSQIDLLIRDNFDAIKVFCGVNHILLIRLIFFNNDQQILFPLMNIKMHIEKESLERAFSKHLKDEFVKEIEHNLLLQIEVLNDAFVTLNKGLDKEEIDHLSIDRYLRDYLPRGFLKKLNSKTNNLVEGKRKGTLRLKRSNSKFLKSSYHIGRLPQRLRNLMRRNNKRRIESKKSDPTCNNSMVAQKIVKHEKIDKIKKVMGVTGIQQIRTRIDVLSIPKKNSYF